MKTKTLNNKKLYLSSASALFLLCACVNGEKKTSSDGSLSYTYQDVAPETHGGAWKRVWQLSGPYAADAAVDEMTDKNADNWKEIARTTNEGVFVQKDTSKEAKYRFDGVLKSDWMPVLSDTLVKSLTPENHFTGRRCVVPADTTLIITNQRLTFRCFETIIEGKIIAYPGNTYNGSGAGSVDILGEIITLNGSIHLEGERGTGGANGRNGGGGRENRRDCTNGGNGGPGGNGGVIQLYAHKKLSLSNEAEQLKVTGGLGGWGGRGGTAQFGSNCRNGAPGATGVSGRTQIISPERPLQ